MKQAILNYINHSQGIHRHEGMREVSSSTLIMLSAWQGSNWYHIFNAFSMAQLGIEHATSLPKADALPIELTVPLWLHIRYHCLSCNTDVEYCFSHSSVVKKENEFYFACPFSDVKARKKQANGSPKPKQNTIVSVDSSGRL